MHRIGAGACLVLDDEKGGHLWVMLTEPYGNPARVLAVNFSEFDDYADGTVILDAKDHPFLYKPTYVKYRLMREWGVTKLLSTINNDPTRVKDDVSGELMGRIRDGVFKSPHSKPRYMAALKAALKAESENGGRDVLGMDDLNI